MLLLIPCVISMFAQHPRRTLILGCYYVAIFFFSRSASSFSLIAPTRFCRNRPCSQVHHHQTRSQLANSNSHAPSSNEIDTTLLESIKSMRVKELKSELQSLNISIRDVFEKEELVQRLYNARVLGGVNDSEGVDAGKKRKKKKKKRRQYDHIDDANNDGTGERAVDISTNEKTIRTTENDESTYVEDIPTPDTVTNNSNAINTPFIYYDLESSKSVQAQNHDDIYIRPSPGKYASIKVQLQKEGQLPVSFTLLVDTACSGLVLSPSAVARANTQCPGIIQTINNAGSMTMAGSSQGTSVAKWDSYTKMIVQGEEVPHVNVGACQDIGALPSGLDGILGLSFLDQFACVDFDFVNNELRLDKTNPNPLISNMNDIVAQGPLSLTKLRIYTADYTLDGRGPVKLLVDSGAASSFLNWNGVSQMKLSSSSTQIDPIREQIGAMGADNMALRLTHRFKLKRRWNLVAKNDAVPLGGIGLEESQAINVDIGDLPVLEALKEDGVGGIVGADLLMMCDVVRFSGLNGSSPRMMLIKQ